LLALTEKTHDKIIKLYGSDRSVQIAEQIETMLGGYGHLNKGVGKAFLTERDVMLITYADNLRQRGQAPLQCLGRFCRDHLKGLISTIHLLPFFPYSSDDGFSVIDYRQVNPASGDWSDIAALAGDFDLCFDLVLNHVSASSDYFKGYLAGDDKYRDFFIALDPEIDTSSVLRPRTSPLLHGYESSAGLKYCWTTFSADQVDFNYANPDVLLEMLDILLFYVAQGARIIRLDAIAYLWKQFGTSCAHLAQTHLVVQLFRDLLNLVAPHVLLLTETNVEHGDNISYFGDGSNEAQMVYNFSLPPLVLYTLTTGNAGHLTDWAATIEPPAKSCTFLNFTASHDGIGVRPVGDLLSADEFQMLIDLTVRYGGGVSYKNDQMGNSVPYELNINYFDALNNPNDPNLDEQRQIDRFLLSQSIALVLLGMPAIYIHSLVGSRGWPEGVKQSDKARAINREKLNLELLEQELADESSLRARIFAGYSHLLGLRRCQKAFHPRAPQEILRLGDAFFSVLRSSVDSREAILAVHNVTEQSQRLKLDAVGHGLTPAGRDAEESDPRRLTDLITGEIFEPTYGDSYELTMGPYQYLWLKTSS